MVGKLYLLIMKECSHKFLDEVSCVTCVTISGTFILKDKPQLLGYFKALHSEQVKHNPMETEAEHSKDWELIAPVIEIHGDSFAPKMFKEYMEVWIRTTFDIFFRFTIVCFVENIFQSFPILR